MERLKAEQERAWQERLEQEDELFERYEQQKVKATRIDHVCMWM